MPSTHTVHESKSFYWPWTLQYVNTRQEELTPSLLSNSISPSQSVQIQIENRHNCILRISLWKYGTLNIRRAGFQSGNSGRRRLWVASHWFMCFLIYIHEAGGEDRIWRLPHTQSAVWLANRLMCVSCCVASLFVPCITNYCVHRIYYHCCC